jgi:glycosyltransferase involved in cell wall biosynthesis
MLENVPRITFFLRTLGGGGAERVLLNLAQGFIEQGLKVDLVVSAGEGLELWHIPTGVRIINFEAPRVSASLPKLVSYLRRERPVAIIPSLHFANEVALLAKYLSGVPTQIVIPEHNVLSKEIQRHEKGIRQHLIPLAVRSLYPFADRVVAVSHGVAEDLSHALKIPWKRIKIIYNPVITPQLTEMAQEPIDHPWFAPGEPPVILGVGRLEAQKDFPTLMRAFALVRQVRPARLAILGWGPDRPQLEALARKLGIEHDFLMPGHVKNPFAYMAKAAVFALSSAWEGLPTVLIEAMALGTPVVSTNCESGPDEILSSGKYGTLVPVGDNNALANAILDVLAGNKKPIDPKWLEQFTLQVTTQHYLEVLRIVVHDKKAALI